MKAAILTVALLAATAWPAYEPRAQVATLQKAEVLPMFSSATKALDGLGDYRVDTGQAKVLKTSPLHIQINAEVDTDTARRFPNAMVDEMVEVLTYGVFRMLIHTRVNEVTVTAMPVLQTYSDKGISDKVMKDKAVQVRMTRAQAEQVAREVVGVARLEDLVAREAIGWGWSLPMQKTLGHKGGRSIDPALLKAMGVQAASR